MFISLVYGKLLPADAPTMKSLYLSTVELNLSVPGLMSIEIVGASGSVAAKASCGEPVNFLTRVPLVSASDIWCWI